VPRLDGVDLEILRLLVADARRPYSDIAEAVDRSAPTVSDRVDRLQEMGVIRQFTADVDRSMLRRGVPVLVTVHPTDVDAVRDGLAGADAVEHLYVTADARVVAHARVADGDVRTLLAETVGEDAVRDYEVALLESADWTPGVGDAAFAVDCAECGNTVDAEGESARIDGSLYHFCCASCRDVFERRYDDLREGA